MRNGTEDDNCQSPHAYCKEEECIAQVKYGGRMAHNVVDRAFLSELRQSLGFSHKSHPIAI